MIIIILIVFPSEPLIGAIVIGGIAMLVYITRNFI